MSMPMCFDIKGIYFDIIFNHEKLKDYGEFGFNLSEIEQYSECKF